ncbi:probable serpin E3 isoform X2 [Uranotaenia lowii]|nr:probable serpin E3 isoform X2 [Uranotaenia lowii]
MRNNQFSISYFKTTFEDSNNLICSPVAARLGLAIFYHVSGPAVDEDLRTMLGLPVEKSACLTHQKDQQAQLVQTGYTQIYNMLCHNEDRPLEQEFFEVLDEHLDVIVEPVDFTDDVMTARTANVWIQSKSCGIDELVQEGDVWSGSQQFLMLFSAVTIPRIRFKVGFDPDRTIPVDFNFSNMVRSVPVMRGSFRVRCCIDEVLECIVVEIPFEDNSGLELLVVQPSIDQRLKDMVQQFTMECLNRIDGSLVERWVDIQLPKFSVAWKTNLKPILSKLTYDGIFELKDLRAFVSGGKEKLDQFYQHCYLKIDENGVEPPVQMLTAEAGENLLRFSATRPFMYIVRKRSDREIVFIGNYSRYVPDPDELF